MKGLLLLFAFALIHQCHNADSEPEKVKLVLVEDDSPQNVLIEPNQPHEYYVRESHSDDDSDGHIVQEFYIDKESDKTRHVNVDVTVKPPGKFDDESVEKKIDVDVKIKDSKGIKPDGEKPDNYNITVKIHKEQPKKEVKENVLVKLVKKAINKYTG